MEFSRQEYWSRLPFPFRGDLPDPGVKLASLALAGGFFTTEPPGSQVSGLSPSNAKETLSPLHMALQAVNSRRCECISVSGVTESAARCPSPAAEHPSALPSPTSSPFSSPTLSLPVRSVPVPVCQLLFCTSVLFKVLNCMIKNVHFLCL